MFSNSKLNRETKDALKALARSLPHVTVEHFPASGMTIAYDNQNTGNCVEFSMACCSPNELKFRKKVGAWYALIRYDLGKTSKMPRDAFTNFCEMLDAHEQPTNW